MSLAYLITWMMVFVRGLGVIMMMPSLTANPPPRMLRVALALLLATLLVGLVPATTVPANLWQLSGLVASEVLIGLAMGFVVRIAFNSVEMAGRMMSSIRLPSTISSLL